MREFTDYKPLTNDEQARLFGVCMPQGLAWDAKGDLDSNLYKLMKSLSTAINLLEAKTYEMVTQWDVRITTDLIAEWETAVGIPDECRGLAEDIATRRSDVLTKLRKIPIITIEDYQSLAELVTGEPAASWDIRQGYGDPASFVLGSDLVTNGDFSAWSGAADPNNVPTSWTVNNNDATNFVQDSTSKARIISDGGTALLLLQTAFLEVGKTYILTLDATSEGVGIGAGIKINSGVVGDVGSVSTVGSKTFTFTANSTDIFIFRETGGQATDITIDNVEVKEFSLDPLYRFILLVTPPSTTSGAFDYPIGTVTGNTQAELDAMAANGRYLLKPDTAFSGYPLAGSFRTDVLKCVFRKVTPSYVDVVFD